MRATVVRRIRIQPLTLSEIQANKLKIVLPPRSLAATQREGADAQGSVPAQTSLLRDRATVKSSAEAIARGGEEGVRAMGTAIEKPDNLRIELGDRGKSLFHKIPKDKRADLKRLLREH